MLRPATLRWAAAAPRRIAAAATCRPSSHFVNTTTMRSLTTQSAETTTEQPTLKLKPTPEPTAAETAARTPVLTTPARTPVHSPKARRLTYLVGRTKSGNLSVYNEVKSGGTRKFTIIQKIEGDRQDLKKDIIAELKFKKDDVNVNPVTGHVTIKVCLGKTALWSRPAWDAGSIDNSYRAITRRRSRLGLKHADARPLEHRMRKSECTTASARNDSGCIEQSQMRAAPMRMGWAKSGRTIHPTDQGRVDIMYEVWRFVQDPGQWRCSLDTVKVQLRPRHRAETTNRLHAMPPAHASLHMELCGSDFC